MSFIQTALENAHRLRNKTSKQQYIPEQLGIVDQEPRNIKTPGEIGRQIHSLTLACLIILTLSTVAMAVSTYLVVQTYRSDRAIIMQIAKELNSPKPSEKVSPQLAKQSEPAPIDQESSAKATSRTSNQEALLPPAIKYVGSITSNKYHYPQCKWAKTIAPRKVRDFASVAEAQNAGYIPCPTCRPPLADNLNPEATGKENK